MKNIIRSLTPSKLSTRFILIILTPAIITQILAVFLFYDRHWYNVSYYTSNIMANEIEWLLDEYENGKINTYQENIKKYPNISYQIQDKSFIPKSKQKLTEELEIFKNILDSKINKKNIISIEGDKKITIFIELENSVMKITFQEKFLLNPTTYIFVLWIIFITITISSISLIFSRNQIKSILELTKAAEAFGNGNQFKYNPSGAYEIWKAGIAFLKMKSQIEKQISKRTQIFAMISHDLRTPLTRIKLQIELMEDTEVKNELSEDINTMQQMIESYLDFAKGETGENFDLVEINDWFKKLIEKKYNKANIKIITIGGKIYSQIKSFAFTRAISNLIENSIKYSTMIVITISQNIYDNNISILIEDNGPGIPDKEKKLVFKPFYRSNPARSLDNSGSVGLGLTIAKEIILNHQGTISLDESKNMQGLAVKINLPRIN